MNTELAKRLEAHKAACADLSHDPLVAAALADARAAAAVQARWSQLRAQFQTGGIYIRPRRFRYLKQQAE